MSDARRWGIRHLDLEEELPELACVPGQAGLSVLLWFSGVPLGKLDYLAEELPVSATALEAAVPRAIAASVGDRLFGRDFEGAMPLRRPAERPEPDLQAILSHLGLLPALKEALALPAPTPEFGRLSVVICTADRPERLDRCLASLAPNLPYVGEVIVVDNGTRLEATRAVVERHPVARYVPEPRRGLSIARNTGTGQARHDIIAFTDDDVVVHRNWAARLLAGFTTPETMCVTGLVLPTELETEAQVVFEREFGGFGQGLRRRAYDAGFFRRMMRYGAPVWRIGAGANMALRRRAVELVGGFDPRLGAGAAGCSEDSEFWYRLLAAGWTCRYEPASVVFHEHRREWQELRRQMHAYMRGHVAALLVQYGRHGHAGNLRRLALSLPRDYLRQIAASAKHRRFSGRFRLLGTEVMGALAGLGAVRWAVTREDAQPRRGEGAMTAMERQVARDPDCTHKASLGGFLARNPFPDPRTLGFFYREKMRAIHRITPRLRLDRILDVGGGQSGITALLYPDARITNLDLDPGYGKAGPNRWGGVGFVSGNATALPFGDAAFDAVMMLDLLEHVPEDDRVAAEAWRVTRPGGFILVSTPRDTWRFPYYGLMRSICRTEEELFAEWGHVRRGYSLDDLTRLFGREPDETGGFINPVTALGHDISFARLGRYARKALWLAASPLTYVGYALDRGSQDGTEIVALWRKG